jgi:flap endonuclease-1
LEKNLKKLNISRDELIIIAIMCGTDFNPGGIKGIGPKKALKLVKEYRDKWNDLFNNLGWFDYFDYSWVEVYNTFKKMPTDDDYQIEFVDMKKDEVKEILMKRDFEEVMLDRSLSQIKTVKTLDNFF